MDQQEIIRIESVLQQHQLLGISKPKHPLFSILRFEDLNQTPIEKKNKFVSNLYQITLKRDCPCKVKYGQTQYDFDNGIMNFYAPKQVQVLEKGDWLPNSGWLILFHPDFIRNYSIALKIKDYGFFGYELNEALILSEDEEKLIEHIFLQIYREINLPIDNFSQEITISNIDLLLTYSNRYYNRQFIVRKPINHSLVQKVEQILEEYFENVASKEGLPTATFIASKLNLSSKYLSDCLKQYTGQTTQQIIHDKLIEKAKIALSTTELRINEVAYQLGFEFPQSFIKLFKTKTNQTPLEYRQSFN